MLRFLKYVKVLLVCVCCLALLSCTTSKEQRTNTSEEFPQEYVKNIKTLLLEADQLRKAKNYDEALKQYNAIVDSALENQDVKTASETYRKLGLTYYYQKEYKLALIELDKSIASDPVSQSAANSFFLKALAYRNLGDETSLLDNLDNCISVYFKLEDSPKKFNTFSKAAVLYKDRGRYEIAMKILTLAYNGYKKLSNDKERAYVCNTIAVIQRMQGNLDVSEKYYREALSIHEKRKDSLNISYSHVKIGNLFKEQQQYESAIQEYQLGIELQEALQNFQEVGKVYNNLGTVQYLQKSYKDALGSYKKALTYKKQEADTIGLGYTYNELVMTHLQLKDVNAAAQYLDTANYFVSKIENKDVLLRNLEVRGEYYQYKGDYETSLLYFKKYHELYAELFNFNQTQIIQEMQERFDSERKQAEIIALADSNKSKDKALKRRDVLLLVLFFLMLLFIVYFLYQRERQRKKEKELELERLSSIHREQESMKGRISKDLHDIITTNYDGIRLKILALPRAKDPKSLSQDIVDGIQSINEEIRLISHRLSPLSNQTKNMPLTEIITGYLSEFQFHRKIFVDVKLPLPKALDELPIESQTHVYGILLEALSNIEKHSQASQLKITHLIDDQQQMILLIADNGIGLTSKKSEGIGLKNIAQRVQLLHGTHTIESKENGTTITLKFPLNPKDE